MSKSFNITIINYNSCSRRFTLILLVHPDFCRSWRHVQRCVGFRKKTCRRWELTDSHRLRRPTKRRRHPVRTTRCEVTAAGNCGTVSSTDSAVFTAPKWPNLFHTRHAVTPCDSNLCLGIPLHLLGQAVCVLGVGGVFVFPSRSSAWNPEKTESQKTYRSFWLGRWLRGLLGGRHLSNST